MKKTIFPKNKIKYFDDSVAVCKISKLLQIFCVYEFFSIYGKIWKWWNAHQRDSKLSWKCHFEELSKGEVLMSWCA